MVEKRSKGRGGMRRPGRLLAVLALTLLASGCYGYTEVSPAAVPPGSDVRLRVNPQAPLKAGEVPLPDGGRLIRGKLLQGSTPDTLVCSVALTNGDPLTPMRGLRGTVLVPLAEVQRLEVRRFQKGRTAGAVAVGALLSYVVLNWAFDVTNPNTVSDGGGGGDNLRVPLFQLHL